MFIATLSAFCSVYFYWITIVSMRLIIILIDATTSKSLYLCEDGILSESSC